MNAKTTVTLLAPLEPGTIKDDILCALAVLRESSPRAAIEQKAGVNSAVFSVALDALVRDGYVMQQDGFYFMHPLLRTEYEFAARPTAPSITTALATPAIPPRQGVTDMKLQQCTGPCGQSKPATEYYANNKQCKRCVLDRQKALKDAREGKSTAPLTIDKLVEKHIKAKPATAPAAAPANELVIPAVGELRCMKQNGGIVVKQLDNEVFVSHHQLQPLMSFLRECLA